LPNEWILFPFSATLILETGSVTDRTTLIGDHVAKRRKKAAKAAPKRRRRKKAAKAAPKRRRRKKAAKAAPKRRRRKKAAKSAPKRRRRKKA